jgi:hypothetical protein
MNQVFIQQINPSYGVLGYNFRRAGTRARDLMTITLVIPILIGIGEIYKGFPNKHRAGLPPEDEPCIIKRIARCANLILALKIGRDALWSFCTYRALANASLEQLKRMPLTLTGDKLCLVLSRDDYVKTLNSGEIYTVLSQNVVDREVFFRQLTWKQIIDYDKAFG